MQAADREAAQGDGVVAIERDQGIVAAERRHIVRQEAADIRGVDDRQCAQVDVAGNANASISS